MSGWGYDDGGDAEATPDAWGAAPTTTRPAVVSNLRDSAVGALFSPDEPSPIEWSGAGAGGRWGDGDGHEDREDGDDAGGWGGDETFRDGDEAHDWGRSDVGDDDGMSVGAADDDAADGGWGLAEDDDHNDRQPVATDAVAGSNERTDRSGRSEDIRFASNGDDANRQVRDLADKENAEASKRRRTSLLGAAAAAAAPPLPPRRMHGWKSNWAVEGMAQAKANSLSAPSAVPTSYNSRETSPARCGTKDERRKKSPSPKSALDSEPRATANAGETRDALFLDSADVAAASADAEGADADAETGRRAVSAWGSDCDSEDELLAGSGLTSIKVQPSSPGAERWRAASLRAAVTARRPFELGAPPGGAPGAGAARESPSRASDSSDDDFGIAVSTRGRGKKKPSKTKPAPAKKNSPAKTKPVGKKTPRSPDAPRVKLVTRGIVDLVDSDDDLDVVPESDAEADETEGFEGDRERERERDDRGAGRDVDPPEYRGVGGPMSRLPRAPAPAPPAAWRSRLPHFTPASELTKGEYRDGEKVFIDYKNQFDGGHANGGDSHSGGGGRWFREAGANKFVDADGEVLEGRAAWRASEREKKNAAAAARSRR